MIFSRHIYKTRLSREEIEAWLMAKKEERFEVFNFRKNHIRINDNSFSIHQRRTAPQDGMFPVIKGEILKASKETLIKLRILPSLLATIFFGAIWLFPPVILISSKNINLNGKSGDLGFYDRLEFYGFWLLIIIPITLIFLLLPASNAKRRIEDDLELERLNETDAAKY